jgi:hypothetical protein
MPIEYKTTIYGCGFKCGTRRRATRTKAEMHEAICWSNPDNKTCKTCVHEIYDHHFDMHNELQGGGIEQWTSRSCEDAEGEVFIGLIMDSLKVADSHHLKPVFNCPYHKLK